MQYPRQSGQLAVFGIITIVLAIVGIFIQSGALTVALADDYLGRPITAQRAVSMAADRLAPLVGTSLLIGLLIGLMAITVIGIPFAIYFGVRWLFGPQAVMLEGQAGTPAMQRSSQLVSGSWWRIFGTVLAVGIVIGLISSLIAGIFAGAAGQGSLLVGLVRLILQIVLTPLPTAVVTLLYFDMRVRKEGLTHETLAGSLPGLTPSSGIAGTPAT